MLMLLLINILIEIGLIIDQILGIWLDCVVWVGWPGFILVISHFIISVRFVERVDDEIFILIIVLVHFDFVVEMFYYIFD